MCRLCREEDVIVPAPATVATITIEEALNLESGDWGGPMGDFPASTRPYYASIGWGWDDNDYQQVDDMIAEMETKGWDGPPVCVISNTLHNGHHRMIAAYMAGLTEIPVTDDWDTSD